MIKEVDILIVGGGLIGLTLLSGLTEQGYRVCLVDNKPLPSMQAKSFDGRSLALSPASATILQQFQCWSTLLPFITEITTIEVSEQGRFAKARLEASVSEPLGYVVEMAYLLANILSKIDMKNVCASAIVRDFCVKQNQAIIEYAGEMQTIRAQLVIAADGADSSMRRFCHLSAHVKNHATLALVTNIGLQKPHQNQAFERFTPQGPMALLPLTQQRMALVWALDKNTAQYYQTCEAAVFLTHLQREFGYRLGRFNKVGLREVFPLRHIIMPNLVEDRVVFIGNAAHTLHPVAGQGFNLGLRDVAILVDCIQKRGFTPEMLASYEQLRKKDQAFISRCTEGLLTLFTASWPGLSCLRSAGLLVFDQCEYLKKTLIHYASGRAGYQTL